MVFHWEKEARETFNPRLSAISYRLPYSGISKLSEAYIASL